MHVLGLLIYVILKVFITSDCNLMPAFLYTIYIFFFLLLQQQAAAAAAAATKIFIDKTPLFLLPVFDLVFWPASKLSETKNL